MVHPRKVVKVRLKKLFYGDLKYDYFLKCIHDANQFITNGYLFLRAFIIYLIENKIEEPNINKKFIRFVLNKIILITDEKKKRGPPFSPTYSKYNTHLDKFLLIFKQFTAFQPMSINNISDIIKVEIDQMVTAINNNIQLHFDKHVTKYIKLYLNSEYEEIKNMDNKDKSKKEKLKQFHQKQDKMIREILSDKSEYTYHSKWMKKTKSLIIPKTYTSSDFNDDVIQNTFSYLKCMHTINKCLQNKKIKSYQFFPIRTSCYQKYVTINTSALIDIFIKNNKREYLNNSGNMKLQEQLWNQFFKLKKDGKYLYSLKGYAFNYEIKTDGFAVSLNMIHIDEIPKKEKLKICKKNGRAKRKELLKNCTTDEEIKLMEDKIEQEKQEKKKAQKEKAKEIQKQKREAFQKLSSEEKEKIKIELNAKSEFPYIDKLIKFVSKREELLKAFKGGRLLLGDPGKRDIVKFLASNKIKHQPTRIGKKYNNKNFGITQWKEYKIMSYTSKTRIKFTKRKKHLQLIESWKEKINHHRIQENKDFIDNISDDLKKMKKKLKKSKNKNVRKQLRLKIKQIMDIKKTFSDINKQLKEHKTLKSMEKELAELNSKSCEFMGFLEYIRRKMDYNMEAFNNYDTNYINKLNWYYYLNKNKHENHLLNVIENEFGKDIIIIIGDWSGKGNSKHISSPNVSFKRLLARRFKVYHIDEYNTSKIHYKENVKCDNLYVIDQKTNNYKKLHAVLTYKKVIGIGCNKKLVSGCINRDKNAILNMERIVSHLLKTKKRLPLFRRKNNPHYRTTDDSSLISKVKSESGRVTMADAKGANREGVKRVQNNKPIINKNQTMSEFDKFKKLFKP